ncbi:MAG: dihydroorotase, partial [Waterburya sp.]
MELLQQVRVIDPSQGLDRLADVLIIEGKIKGIADRLTDYPSETEIISGNNLILGTGLVDLYSHSSEPGYESRESLLNLAQAAAAGGFTQVGILPDTTPRINNSEVLAALNQKSSYLSSPKLQLPQLGFWGEASQASTSKQMSE